MKRYFPNDFLQLNLKLGNNFSSAFKEGIQDTLDLRLRAVILKFKDLVKNFTISSHELPA